MEDLNNHLSIELKILNVIVIKDTVEIIVIIALIQVLRIQIVKKDHLAQEFMIQLILMLFSLEDNMIKTVFQKMLRDIFQKIV
jgi:hypothetical protein